MRSCVYITDPDWIAALHANGVTNGINFWRKDKRNLDLLPGTPFFFKLRGSNRIVGRGYFRNQLQLTIPEAWEKFQEGNGVSSLTELRERAIETLKIDDDSLNCLILDNVELLRANQMPEIDLARFPHGIMGSKFFEDGVLADLERHFSKPAGSPELIGAQIEEDDLSGFDPQYISTARQFTLRSVCVRRGQPQFRNALMTSYDSHCCVTGEGALPALEAAHIHPYLGTDTNHPSNGLLLRSDWHTIFDLGLWALEDDLTIRVSPLLGGSYDSYKGHAIARPRDRRNAPSLAAIRYHRDKIFRSK